jgi:Membrane protein involved in the export of O-antigen and teichoic acid
MNSVQEEFATGETEAAAETPRHGFRSVVQAVASKVGILGLQAGTGILTARMLKPEGRGELAAMILWPLFIASLTTLGVPSALIYHLRHHPERKANLVTNAFIMSATMGTIAAIVTALILPLWLHQYSRTIVRFAEIFLITVPLCSVTLAGRAALEAEHDFSGSNAIQILTPFSTLVVLIGLLIFHRLDAYTAAVAYIIAALPSFWLMVRRIRNAGVEVGRVSVEIGKQLLSYGVRSYGVDLLGTLALQVDQVLVVSLLSAGAMGSYVVVLSLSRMLNVFQTSVVMVLFPKAAGHSKDAVLAMTGRAVRISGLATAACGLIVCTAGPALLGLLYGAEYVTATGALRILVLEATLSGVVFVLAQAFMALNHPGVVTILQALGLSLSIPLMIWLIPKYGIYGAAVALLTSTVARLLFVSVGFRIFLKTAAPSLWPEWRDIRFVSGALFDLCRERAA